MEEGNKIPNCPEPVLLLFFNRPQHAAAVLDRVRQVQPPRIYLHVDGPRPHKEGEVELVARTRALAQEINWPCEVKTLFREENKGMREGVASAINWFFSEEESGIVVEDDCLPHPSFFPFCCELLERYRHTPEVLHIGGSNLIERHTKEMPDSYFFTRFSLVWGWASWRRAWANMSIDLRGLDTFEKEGRIRAFTPRPLQQLYMLDKFRVTQQRRNQSWAYAWFYSILQSGGICIVPTVNLIENTGVGDPNATNTSKLDPKSAIKATEMQFPLQHPTAPVVHNNLEDLLFQYTQKTRFRLFLWYIKRWIIPIFLFSFCTTSLPAQSPYQYSWKREMAILTPGLTAGVSGWLLGKRTAPLSTAEIAALDRNDITWAFDRSATLRWNPQVAHRSDQLVYLSGLATTLPALHQWKSNKSIRPSVGIALMAAEALTLSNGLALLTKNSVRRTRPYVYNPDAPFEKKQNLYARQSFFSGHSVITATSCIFTAQVFSDLYPHSKWKPVVWAGAIALPLTTGYMRYRAGHHFPTDVLVGLAVGGFSGWLVPFLHK